MPSTRSLARFGSAIALLALAAPVAAQSPRTTAELGLGPRIAIRFGVALFVNLLLGGVLVATSPDYATKRVAAIRDDLAGAFGWGLLVGIGGVIAIILLAITVIGLLVALPAILVLAWFGLVGNAVTVVWVGSSLASDSPTSGGAVGLGALALACLAAIPVLGNLVTTLLGFVGLGVVSRAFYQSWQAGR